MPKHGLVPGTAAGECRGCDGLFVQRVLLWLDSSRLGGGACKAGRAWGNMADAPPPPIPHAQGFSIRRTLIDLARFLLGSDSYAGGEGYCKSGRISTDEVGLETSSRREPRPLRQRRWLQFCSHFKRVLPERTVRGRSNPHIADPLNP